ncbi:MAG: hypothetical protein J5I91_05100 [Bacteroidetes bacterium]|nr:hypothetical protein [Bacteroidota bacterium]
MNIDLLTQKIKKIAHEISGLTRDIEHNSSRRQFYSELIKQKIFDLYDLAQELCDECKEKEKEVVKERHFLKPNQSDGIIKKIKEEEKTQHVDLFNKKTNEEPLTEHTSTESEETEHISASQINSLEKDSREEIIETSIPVTVQEENSELLHEEKTSTPIETLNQSNNNEQTEIPNTQGIDIKPQEEDTSIPLTTLKVGMNKVSLAENQKMGSVDLTEYLNKILEEITAKKTLSNDISHKLQSAPITNFYNTVSISQKHQYIDELFDSKQDVYRSTLQKIEDIGNLSASIAFLGKEIASKYGWERKEKLASEFLYLVKRRFL